MAISVKMLKWSVAVVDTEYGVDDAVVHDGHDGHDGDDGHDEDDEHDEHDEDDEDAGYDDIVDSRQDDA